MRKTKILSLVTVILLVGMAVWSFSFAREAPGKEKDNTVNMLRKPTGEPLFQILNINNLWWWMKNNGESSHSPNDDSGIYYPRGMVWCIYKDGIKWSGRAYMDEDFTQPAYQQRIRIGGNDYGNGTDEGWIEGYAETAEQIPAGDARVRLWRIRRDYYSMSVDENGNWTDEITRDAKEYNELGATDAISDDEIQEVYDLYDYDWKNWPVDLGAPYVDRNGNGQYDPPPDFSDTFTYEDLIPGGYDEPGVVGGDVNSPADQVIWNVFNDLDETKTLGLEGSYPMGWEIQRTVWGYKRTDAMGNIAFSQTLLINKGGVEIDAAGNTGIFYFDSCWVWQWSDPDLGAFSDDLLGCDTVLNMGYVYNGNAIDREYARYGQVVPAAGYDFLAGPIVESPGDVAVFNLKYRQDYANLGMTAFFWFSAGSPISDPDSDYEGGLEWDAMARGFQPLADRDVPYPVPPGTPPTKFPLSGDPVTQTGLVDGQGEQWSFAPGDRRLGLSSGPWQIGPGDTQQVVIGFVVGQGSDRLSSISVMKFNDRFAQITYDALFQVPSAPKQPIVAVTELDEKIVLNWGSNLTRVNDIEKTVTQPGAYTFEGYNVYQLPRERSQLNEAKRIATYDLLTDPTVILDEQFDRTSGRVLFLPVQYGSNSGVYRYFEFDRDYIRDIDKIYNGEEYYLAITAYSRATVEGYIPATLESTPQVYTVIPKVPFGTEYNTAYGDTLTVDQVAGTSDGVILPMVVDPKVSTGHTYEITFEDSTGGVVANMWTLTDKTSGTVLLEDKDNFAGEGYYDIIHGIYLNVAGPPLEGKDWDWTGDRWFTGAGGGELVYGGAYLGATWGHTGMAPPDYKPVEVRFVTMTGYDDADGNGEYDYGETYYMPAEGTQKAFFNQQRDENNWLGFFDVPFTVWDISDEANPRQLNVVVRDWDGNGQWDITGGDINYNYVYIADTDYDPTGQIHLPTSQGGPGFFGTNSGDDAPILWVLWLGDRGHPVGLYGADVVLTLIPNFVITTSDVYEFISPAPDTGVELEKYSAENVGVYPNPYYAFNPAELTRLSRFVTFNNLPPEAKIRIFNLAGHLVRVIEKDNTSQFQRWDLLNNDGLPVASGMYIAHLTMTMPTDGSEVTKVLKLAVIQEQEVLDVY
jgi:hypothetical protein